jgi:transmembrane sensor
MSAAVDKNVALQAAQWFFLMQSGEATPAERTRWTRWREADPSHEAAWQRAEQVSRKFGMLPGGLAMPALGRTARTDRRTAVKALAVLLTAAPAGWLAWRASPAREWLADHRTATGERREVRLPDGTRIQLNTATAIDVDCDNALRLVRLRAGEILIDTAPDRVASGDPAYRPFVVETAQGRLRALGTRFVVRQYEDRRSHVAVLEGAVEVRPDDARGSAVAPLVLRAGEQAGFSASAVDEVVPVGAEADDWSRGVLRAKNMRLHDFLTELARYRPGVLRCDPAVAGLRVSGVFQLNDTDPVLHSLPQALPVDVLFRTRYWVTVVAPGG